MECRDGLIDIGHKLEGSHNIDKKLIELFVLLVRNNALENLLKQVFFNKEFKSVFEVEAGRRVLNNSYLKDLLQDCMMQDIEYLTSQ